MCRMVSEKFDFGAGIQFSNLAVFAPMLGLVFATKCVQMRQRAVLQRLLKLLNRLTSARYAPFIIDQMWIYTCRQNKIVQSICVDIQAYSRHFLPFLTVAAPSLIGMQCYMFYIMIMTRDKSFEKKLHFLFAGCMVVVLLFAITYQCAKVVKNNSLITVANSRLYHAFQLHAHSSHIKTIHLLKVTIITVEFWFIWTLFKG
jgi:hypothetical protein